jgi:hypothetical protein
MAHAVGQLQMFPGNDVGRSSLHIDDGDEGARCGTVHLFDVFLSLMKV